MVWQATAKSLFSFLVKDCCQTQEENNNGDRYCGGKGETEEHTVQQSKEEEKQKSEKVKIYVY